MGCGGSSGSDGKIEMKKTKLGEIDEVFDDAQGLLDEIYEIKDPIDDSREQLLWQTEFDKVECGNTHHATCGIVYALTTCTKPEELANLFAVKAEAPFLEINKESASGELAQAIDDLMTYIQSLVAAKDRIGPLSDKAKAIAEKAPDLPDKAKEGVKNSKDLGAMDKYVQNFLIFIF